MTPTARRKANAFIALVSTGGVVAAALAWVSDPKWISANLVTFLAVTGAVVVAERLVVSLAFSTESMAFSMVEIGLTIALLILPSGPFVLATGLGMAIAQVLRRRQPMKVAFNTGMYTLAAAGASGVFQVLTTLESSRPPTWVATLLSMAAFFCLNHVLLATIIGLHEGRGTLHILKDELAIGIAVAAGNSTLGSLGYFLIRTDASALWLLPVPVALTYVAYKAWVNSKNESEKMRQLYMTGSLLMSSLGEDQGMLEFLRSTKKLFRADGAELVTCGSNGKLIVQDSYGAYEQWPLDGSEHERRFEPLLREYLSTRKWRNHLAAPLSSEVGASGALVVFNHNDLVGPADFPRTDAPLLQMLANEASVAIRNVALFESISEERGKLSDIVEHTSDGIFQVGADRRVWSWNPAMETITGYSAAEAVGQLCFNVLRARDSRGVDMCSSDCPILEVGRTCSSHDSDAQILTKDGAARWIHYTHNPIFDAGGKMTSDVVVVRDVTKERAAQELQDDFVATVSHELRTPITPIKGFLLTLMRDDVEIPSSDQRKYFGMMLRQAERLEALVEDLLEASRLESGSMRIDTSAVDVAPVVEEVVDTFRASFPARQFDVSADGVLAARANLPRLEQVLANLLSNAVRYAPAGRPIEVIARGEEREVVIAVRDHGPGIAYNEQEKVFERFYRSGHHLTREQGGTGLGLYIAKRLTEAMGGRLSLSSRRGLGSTFYIHLPATAAPVKGRLTRLRIASETPREDSALGS